MKKYILFFALFICMPAFALCPTEGESVCTLPDNNPSVPLFQQQDSSLGDNLNNSFQPSNLNNSFEQNFNKNKVDINSSLGCQFGNCNQGLNNPLLKNP